MLAKNLRLDRKEFNRIFREGKTFHSDFLFAKILKENRVGNNFSVSVPTKVSKKAAGRNKLRRRGYSIIKNNLTNLKGGSSVIVILKKGAEELNFDEYKKEMESLLKKISK
ncbi:MAG TPA: ribonuclease P protein component [Candidatus Nanoarchaeia archaeon]|nr:ribonuclease P protein component [Candidatus Nanoarchaeia archaeon]